MGARHVGLVMSLDLDRMWILFWMWVQHQLKSLFSRGVLEPGWAGPDPFNVWHIECLTLDLVNGPPSHVEMQPLARTLH